MQPDIERKVISIIADVSGCDEEEIKPETNLAKELDIDSIKAIEIAVFIEKKFKISIRDEDISKIVTVEQVLDLVRKTVMEGDEMTD